LFNIQGTPGKVLSIENVFFRFFQFSIFEQHCTHKLCFKIKFQKCFFCPPPIILRVPNENASGPKHASYSEPLWGPLLFRRGPSIISTGPSIISKWPLQNLYGALSLSLRGPSVISQGPQRGPLIIPKGPSRISQGPQRGPLIISTAPLQNELLAPSGAHHSFCRSKTTLSLMKTKPTPPNLWE
jgi:hypothetical protein